MNKVIIIPDVHGRTFWHTALSWIETSSVVFLGDYLDPYWDEGIDGDEAYAQLFEIIGLKKKYPDSITLLLGNHDLHYLSSHIGGCRYDWNRALKNKELLWTNIDLFNIAHAVVFNGGQYLFTHAGVLNYWYQKNYALTGAETATGIATTFNEQFHSNISYPALINALSSISPIRGGTGACGSPVWADVCEHNKDNAEFEGIYQIFGHSLMFNEIITPHWACLDCRTVFCLNLLNNTITRL